MVQFHPGGELAFVVSSFNSVVDIVDVRQHKVIKRLNMTSSLSSFLQFTPDFKEVWMTLASKNDMRRGLIVAFWRMSG